MSKPCEICNQPTDEEDLIDAGFGFLCPRCWHEMVRKVHNGYSQTNEQKAAFIIAQSVSALISAMGFQAENKIRELDGKALAYGADEFIELIAAYLNPIKE